VLEISLAMCSTLSFAVATVSARLNRVMEIFIPALVTPITEAATLSGSAMTRRNCHNPETSGFGAAFKVKHCKSN